jgi:ABC-type nitrate/sulfonate/bicarbonate transport system substrate-binding protein
MFKKSGLFIALMLVLTVGILGGCTKKTEAPADVTEAVELQKVTVTLDWTPNTNHTGLYVAKENGFYEEAGLDVEIVQPAGGTAEQLVATDKAQFGISYQEGVTLARIEEVPVVSIAAIIQHNTSGFASLKSKGIETPKDFEGNSYGGWGSPIEVATIKALMDDDGADIEKVEILTSGAADFFAASESDVDFSWVFEGWTGIEAKLKGVELNYIDLGKQNAALDYYTPVIITSEKNINENSEMVKKFMEATAKGYEFAIENPDKAGEMLLINAPELDKELVMASQEFLSDKYQAEASQWGVQRTEVWDNYTSWLFERELISKKIDPDKAFTNEFLPKK